MPKPEKRNSGTKKERETDTYAVDGERKKKSLKNLRKQIQCPPSPPLPFATIPSLPFFAVTY